MNDYMFAEFSLLIRGILPEAWNTGVVGCFSAIIPPMSSLFRVDKKKEKWEIQAVRIFSFFSFFLISFPET